MEKNGLQKKNSLRVLAVSFISFIAGGIYTIATTDSDYITILLGGLVGLIIGFSIVYSETYLTTRISKRFNFVITILIRSSLYSFIIMGVLILNDYVLNNYEASEVTIIDYISNKSIRTSIIFSISLTLFFIFMFQLNDLIGRGVLIKFIFGRYHTPREEKKIFMFLDLKNSTSIAEKIGHTKFLSLINDFFYDLTNPVLSTGGEIYKYVGDEAIITWNFKKGIKNNNAVNIFYLLNEVLEERKEYYLKEYKLFPQFKAGLHGGIVVTGEVGVSKKEITYLGDIINTTSRIEGMCNKLNEEFLISSFLFNHFTLKPYRIKKEYKEILLRGKKEPINLISLVTKN